MELRATALQAPLPGPSVSSAASVAADVASTSASFAFAETPAELQGVPAVAQPAALEQQRQEDAASPAAALGMEQATGTPSGQVAAQEAAPQPSNEEAPCVAPVSAFAIAGG